MIKNIIMQYTKIDDQITKIYKETKNARAALQLPRAGVLPADARAALQHIRALEEEAAALEIARAVIINNYYYSIHAEIIPGICDVINRHAGRQYGPKTAENIRREILERYDVNMFIESDSYTTYINIYGIIGRKAVYYCKTRIIDAKNRIQEITPAAITCNYKYHANIYKHAAKLQNMKKRIQESAERINKQIELYNAATVEGVDMLPKVWM